MENTYGRAERIIGQSRALGEDVRGLASELSEAAREVRAKVDFSRSIQAHPFRSIALACGVGYLLGGGLFTPLTGRLLRVGLRAMVLPLVKGQLEAMVTGAALQEESPSR